MTTMRNIEIGLICLCYTIGIGSILFGSLSGNKYGYYFVVTGFLALILVIVHTSRKVAGYTEKENNNKMET